jgi:hypothetical protein
MKPFLQREVAPILTGTECRNVALWNLGANMVLMIHMPSAPLSK